MKVLQLIPELNEGGVERGVLELSREFVKLNIDSYVMSNGGKLVKQIENDGSKHIKFDVCSKNIFTLPLRVFALRKILKELKPDIIHARSRVPAWIAYLANKSLSIKFVTTVHGFNSVGFYSSIMQKGDKVICVSNSIKDYIQTNYNTNEDIISVIPRGVDAKLFNKECVDLEFINEFNKEFNLDDKFVISSIGRVTQLKDYGTFLKAVNEIKKEKPNVVALIVGGVRSDKNDYLESLKKLIKDLNLDKNVVFTGSQSKIAEIYFLSDVIVSSSKKPESFGRAVAEAISMDKPVVASNHGGVKDIIIENENGFFFEVGDSKDLCEKILKAKDLKFDGHNYIKDTFSLDNMVEKTFNTYKVLV